MTQTAVEMPVTSTGLWKRLHSYSIRGAEHLYARVVEEIVAAVRLNKDDAAAQTLERGGLGLLHTVIDARDIGAVRDHVIETLRNDFLQMAVSLGRSELHWCDEFYIDDYVILRINFPYEVARRADGTAENPGIGRISPWMRDAAKSRRVVDPVYDPKGYHRGHPPAAWAHGPHIDSWAGHSKDGLNIWWAISPVPAEAGMILYPELAGEHLPCDRRTLYLQSGYPLPKPTFLPLEAGELLLFDPEILHGTHLNLSEGTRVAVSLRLNAGKPTFDPACFYAREFWRRASDIEAQRYGAVLHLKREENLAMVAPLPETAPRSTALKIAIRAEPSARQVVLGESSLVQQGSRITVDVQEYRVLVFRIRGELRAVNAACPHYGVDLTDGAADEGKIFCPACGVSFDILSGVSLVPSLTLQTFDVREDNGHIVINLPPPNTSPAGYPSLRI
jgi:nitrite reductase/ring-hydroxylating ferredoxin subunit